MMRGYDWGWGGWLAMSVMMVLFWGLVIAGIVVLVRYLTGSRQGGGATFDTGPTSGARPSSSTGREDAEDILAERFARGEIDEDEYTRRRELLRSGR
jgi:putative membrane protein